MAKLDLKDHKSLWQAYERGRMFNTGENVYNIVERNERFYEGDQWHGVNAPDMDLPVLNIIQQPINFMIAVIVNDDVTISLKSAFATPQDERYLKCVVKEVERIREQQNVKKVGMDSARNCAVDGEAALYHYWDETIKTGQRVRGDVRCELIENTNCLFGNTREPDPQKQPYIIIVRERYIEDVIYEAMENGMSEDKARELIVPDTERMTGEVRDDDLVTTLTVLKRDYKTKHIHAVISAKETIIKQEWDTELYLYPVSWFRWQAKYHSYHGAAIATQIIPNQVIVNKLIAELQQCTQQVAFPKVVYDGTRIREWDGRIGAHLKVNGGDVNSAFAQIIPAANASPDVVGLVNLIVDYTRQAIGANEGAMGEVSSDNTSAIIASQEANTVPLELQRKSFYDFAEQNVRITLDFLRAKAGTRYVPYDEEDYAGMDAQPGMGMPGELKSPITDYADMIGTANDPAVAPPGTVPIDFAKLDDMAWSLHVDIGAGSPYSEMLRQKTMETLTEKGIVLPREFIEYIDDRYIAGKQKILERLKREEAMQASMPPNPNETATGGGMKIPEYSNRVAAAKDYIEGLRPDAESGL